MTRHPCLPPLVHATAWRRSWLRVVAWLQLAALVAALVLAPALGQIHRVLHAGVPVAAQAEARTPVHAHGHRHPALADLFGAHGSGSDCRLYDQLGHGDLGCGVAALALPPVLAAAPLLVLREGAALARRAALFDARAPPVLR